jgi:hypothetical protein
MTTHRRLLAGAIGLSLVLAACGGSSTASSGTGATTAPATAAPVATEAPVATDAPAATEAPAATDDGGGGLPDGATNDLANLLPETVNGVAYQRAGFDGDQLGAYGAMAGIDMGELEPVLQQYGKTVNDLNVAVATPAGSTELGGMIMAMQLEGVPAAELMGATGMASSDMTKSTVGGKEVYTAGGGGFGVVVYPKDDVLFMLLLTDAATSEAILSALP